ncbi:MAG TPA: hypothetical protein PLZ68_11130 [Ferruginibacter sp.]|nr:hypothetical protein [Ferruginibacter sp.]
MIQQYSHKMFFSAMLLLLTVTAFSQAGNKKRRVFHSFNSLQLLMGKTNNSFSIHSVNGLQWNKFFAGAGIGFDYYYHTSVPLFLELRHDITNGERKLQVFANGGVHIPFGNTNKIEPGKTGDFKPGRLFAAGVDYYIPLKKDAVVFGLAFSQKKETQMVDNNIWNPRINRIENVPLKEVYEFNRIWLKFGWVF